MTEPWKGAAHPPALREQDFAEAAARLGCDVAAIKAVAEVEARGQPFLADGSVIRRFEPHHFPPKHWQAIRYGEEFLTAAQRARAVSRGWTGKLAAWQISVLQSSEAMFQKSAEIDRDAAIAASSWGWPQIMAGMNHRDAGFDTPPAMVEHMAEGAPQQLGAFVKLIEAWGIDSALRGHDWRAFARRYNGSGQVDHYARLMESAYRKHSGKASPVILRVGDRGAAVKELQRALGVEDDGAFGPATLAAVERFQKASNLPMDGVVGARTWAALQGARPEVAPKPPAQETTAEHNADITGKITGAAAAATAVAGAAGSLRDVFPPEAFTYLIYGGMTLAFAYVAVQVAIKLKGAR